MNLTIVQCRLGSTRLPSKALLPLGGILEGKTCIEWTLRAMKNVTSDAYYLATDAKSFNYLSPIAQKNGWECFAGSENDVLDRFCSLIKHAENEHGAKIDLIIRATGDNPFLFFDAAQSLLEQCILLRSQGKDVDYITYTGLPHGSGIEILNAQSLLEAQKLTQDPYDTEHVGPALYNHKDRWNCLFIPSPKQWYYPDLRTTIDTYADYRKALRASDLLSVSQAAGGSDYKPDSAQILAAFEAVSKNKPVLCVPQTGAGFGTGHARRMIDLASKLDCDIFIPETSSDAVRTLIQNAVKQNRIKEYQIVTVIELFQGKKSYNLVVADYFKMNPDCIQKLRNLGPLASIDEGFEDDNGIDYTIQIIPPLKPKKMCNVKNILLLDLPERQEYTNKIPCKEKVKVLICIGGEDPADLSYKAAVSCAQALRDCAFSFSIDLITDREGEYKTAVLKNPDVQDFKEYISFSKPSDGLAQRLSSYDLLITHYGLTAFESVSLGIPLILLGTTKLHCALAKKYGFPCIDSSEISSKAFFHYLQNRRKLSPGHKDFLPLVERKTEAKPEKKLHELIHSLSEGSEHCCPLCLNDSGTVAARTENKTVRRCTNCGILYTSWTASGSLRYGKSYFFEEYKKQYGKTYLDDFEQIKALGLKRITQIQKISDGKGNKTVLDIGCAYGPFLQAAFEAGYKPFGTDISSDAVEYVKKTLQYSCCTASFPDIDTEKEFGLQKFDAVTMWFVIEHFQNLKDVLSKVSVSLTKKGVFAFSTPNASGVSRLFSPYKFFAQSPLDHYTIWEMRTCKSILKEYGFTVKKIVCTGHHSERFPIVQKTGSKKGSFLFTVCTLISRLFSLGDTFEVYCIKRADNL